jgi:hypothetical protein
MMSFSLSIQESAHRIQLMSTFVMSSSQAGCITSRATSFANKKNILVITPNSSASMTKYYVRASAVLVRSTVEILRNKGYEVTVLGEVSQTDVDVKVWDILDVIRNADDIFQSARKIVLVPVD